MNVSRRTQRGEGLIAVLVAVTIIMIVFIVLYGKSLNREDRPATRPGGPTTRLAQGVDRGKEVACRNNLGQIRLAITMAKQSDIDNEANPPSLASLSGSGIMGDMLKCPVTKQDYRYDPSTGVVACPTQGHEAF